MVKGIPFSPDWVSPPGDTISTLLRERCVHAGQFATSIQKSTHEVQELIEGRLPITPEVAQKLAAVLGATVEFWLNREGRYRNDLARLRVTAADPESLRWLAELPVKDMTRLGWVDASSDKTEMLCSLLRFFGVPSVAAWRDTYAELINAIAFRTSPTYQSLPGAVAAWIRQGELEASKIDCSLWNADRLRNELIHLRNLTRESDPNLFLPELVRRCATCGVAVVVLRAPKSCRASGATKFITPAKPLLLLSFRYLSDDHFWFTFFHEVGHLLLHANKCLFLEGDDRLSSDEEDEANNFAANLLIPPEHRLEMLSLPAKKFKVARFAKVVGVSPGIVVGQLQHHGVIRRDQLNYLKRRYRWIDKEQEAS